jgi:signal transduction histidine kinase
MENPSLRSLRVRLLLLIIGVLAVAGGLSAWLASLAIAERFEKYVINHQVESQARRTEIEAILPQLMADHYAQRGGWANAADLVRQFAQVVEERIILTDAEGQIVVDTTETGTNPAVSADLSRRVPIMLNGQLIGALTLPPPPPLSNSVSEKAYIASVNRSLLIAVLAAGALAVLLTLALSRGILRRVKALTAAVQQMERGDLSQRVPNNAKDEIGQLAHAFNAMADSLARIEQLRRNMVSDVAHELRTPLSNIRGYLEAIQDGLVQPTPAAVNSLHEEALLLHRLINDLQELAVAEAGQLKLDRQWVGVGELVDKAVQVVKGRVNGSRVIHTEVAPGLPLVDVDSERIGQVLRNLLNNAVDYSASGGKITVGARQVNGDIQVNVYNEGAGIAPEHLPNVFERFYRVDHSRTRATGGSGLGLAIVKQLIEAHQGRVWVESAPGAYANFYFSLPIGEPPRVVDMTTLPL